MSENLKRILREEIACHDAQLFTTPHLSRIRHAQAGLLALLEEPNNPAATPPFPVIVDEMDRTGPPQLAPGAPTHFLVRGGVPLHPPLKDTLTLVSWKDGKGP